MRRDRVGASIYSMIAESSVGTSQVFAPESIIQNKKFTNVPFTGEVPAGKISKGKKYGEWITFYTNGQLKTLENFNEKQNGQ